MSISHIFAGIVLLAFSVQVIESKKCYNCTGCMVQASLGDTSKCHDNCIYPGTEPDEEFINRCSKKFFCGLEDCYCSKQACDGAQIMMSLFVVLAFTCVTFLLKHFM